MKSTGMSRPIDSLGRIVLPIEIRRTLDLSVRDTVEIYIEEDKVILKKYSPTCVFCGNSENVTQYRGKLICQECLDDLSAL